MQTFITTTAVIEKQKSPMLTEKSKLKSKAHNDFERENIGVDYNHVNSGSEENIDFSDKKNHFFFFFLGQLVKSSV